MRDVILPHTPQIKLEYMLFSQDAGQTQVDESGVDEGRIGRDMPESWKIMR